jgi:methyl-accepting chemotaxis protein
MSFFSSMTIGKRLYLGFGLILAILTAVSLMAIVKVQAINAALEANSSEHAAVQRYAINFRGSAHDRAIATRDVVLSASSADRAREVAAIEELARFYAKSAGPLEALLQKSADAAELGPLYRAIQDIEARTVATTKAVIAKVEAGDTSGAQNQLWSEAKPQYVAWLAAINRLIDFEESRIQALNAVAVGHASGFLTVMLIALAAALVCGVALAWTLARSVVQQLGGEPAALGQVAQRVSEGDLSPVAGASAAPAGSVLASLGAMQASLAHIVGQVRNASDSIATGSAEIASGNADLSQRTERQAASGQLAANRQFDGPDEPNRAGQCRYRAPGGPTGRRREWCGGEGWHDRWAGGRDHGRHLVELAQDWRHHRRDRRHRVSNQHPGAERRRRSGARGRAGPGIRGGGVRGAQPGPAQRPSCERDQGADRCQRG